MHSVISVLKWKGILTQATTCMSVEVIMLNGISQAQDRHGLIALLYGTWSSQDH
jgi:hypothetical protein